MNSINEKIPFLRVVPDGWKTRRLKEISKINLSNVDKKSHDGEKVVKLCNYVDVYYNHTISDKIDFMIATASDEQIRKLTLKKDDVILTKDSESPSDIGIPTWVKEDMPEVVCGYHLALIRPNVNVVTGLYLYYLLYSYGFKEHFWISAKGVTRFGISKGDIQNIQLLIPPIELQNKITRYLKEKDLLIDKLIKKKENLIMLLQQQRQSIITEAVTKGLNSNVKMKDSGVEWIGEIPEHWTVNKIKRIVDILTCGYASTPTYVDESKGVPFLSAQNVSRSGKLKLEKYNYISQELHNSLTKYKKPMKGDILQVRVGAGIGQTCIVDVDFDFSIYVSLSHIRVKKFIHNKYLTYILGSRNFNEYANMQTLQAGGVGNLNVSDLEKSKIPYPSLKEQIEIASYLEVECSKIDNLVESINKQIEKLKEYRQALIYEAVTGKIDVRDMELD